MAWWIAHDGSSIGEAASAAAFEHQSGTTQKPYGPFGSDAIANAFFNQHFGSGGKQPTGGSGGSVPLPGKFGTFQQWYNWINSKAPGQGAAWISWIQSNAKITPPESATVDMSSNQFGDPGTGAIPDNYASNWFGAWILLGQVGPDLARILADGISAGAGKIPKILTGVGEGIGKTPGAQLANWNLAVTGVSGWFMRGLKIAFGGVLIILGVSRLTGAENAITSAASKVKVIPL